MNKRLVKIQKHKGQHWVGNGFPVRQMFGYNDLGRTISPFLLLDYAGPAQFPPSTEPRGVGSHPHRGFETVTIVYSGEVAHRDSYGNSGIIGPGDVQWMTAASGVLHEEMHSKNFQEHGGEFEVIQLWVNLPAQQKMTAPGYQPLTRDKIPTVHLANQRGALRIIAGCYRDESGNDHLGAAQTKTPVNLWDISLLAGCRTTLNVPSGHTAVVFCRKGTLSLGDGDVVREAELAVLSREGSDIRLESTEGAKFLFMGGQSIEEPMVGLGPFVMNTKEEIQQAYLDFEQGLFGTLG